MGNLNGFKLTIGDMNVEVIVLYPEGTYVTVVINIHFT